MHPYTVDTSCRPQNYVNAKRHGGRTTPPPFFHKSAASKAAKDEGEGPNILTDNPKEDWTGKLKSC